MSIRTLVPPGIFLLLLLLFPASSNTLGQAPGQWVSIGPQRVAAPALPGFGAYNAVGRVTTIAIDPANPQVIYVGSPGELGHEGCGIWKTTNGGQSWTPIGDTLPTLAVAAIAIEPTNTNRIYIATADDGIFRSDDAGQKWINLSGPLKVRTNTRDGDRTTLLVDPTNPNVLYLTTDDGVRRSSDGGQSWPVSLDVGSATNLVMDPLNPLVLYAGILGQGVYKTVDGGINGNTSWQLQNQSPLPPSPLPTDSPASHGPLLGISHPANDANATVYALYPMSMPDGIGWELFRTTDGTFWGTGALYSCVKADDGCNFAVVAADPANRNLVFLGGPLLFIAEIGVTNFTRVPAVQNDRQPDSPHGDYWELAFAPSNPQIVYAGSDGGVYRSSNHGATGTWAFIGDGITNVEMYDLAQAATQPNLLLAGTQDTGNIRYTGSPVWDHVPDTQIQGGDGAAVAIDPSNANVFYTMVQLQTSLAQSLTGGEPPILPFASGLPTSSRCAVYDSTFHFQVHPTVTTTLLASCKSLWRTTTNVTPGNWTSIFAPVGAGPVVRSAVDGISDLYYVGTRAGHVFVVAGPSDGTEWSEILSHPDAQNVSDIEVDPAHPEIIYVSFAPPYQVDRPCADTTGQSRIYQLNRLSAVPNLTFSTADVTGNLRSAELCVNALAVDPHIPRTLYAGTNHGVYRGRSNAAGGPWVWEPYNNGMPLADVRDLEVHPTTGNIDAATYGRSAFELVPETILPVGIDIKPGSLKNEINIKSAGKIPVAIFSTATFDAPGEINESSLHFGRTGMEASFVRCDAEDVNADGLLDLVCHFDAKLAGFQLGDFEGILTGLTVELVSIVGRDLITVFP
jgi:Sortilin, neurotensin receptor 3,